MQDQKKTTAMNPTEIIIHCSATPEGRDVTVRDIDSWHRARGFNGIGYHYVIYLDGSVHRGRPETAVGAHCTGHNSKAIGICYVGGVARDGKTPKDTRTPAQKAALRNLVDEIRRRRGPLPVYGHREFANKACPSFDVRTGL